MEDIEILDMLPELDSEGNEIYQKTNLNKKYDLILNKIELKGFETADSGKKFSARERLAIFWKNRGRKRLRSLEQQRMEEQQNEDYNDLPEEHYRDFYKNLFKVFVICDIMSLNQPEGHYDRRIQDLSERYQSQTI